MDLRTVELRLTLATSRPRDLVVRAPAGTTWGELAARLDGGPTGPGHWSVDGVTVAAAHLLGHPPLLDGCCLRPDGGAAAPAAPTRYEVHVVEGPQVGLRLPARSALVTVGREDGNDLVLDDVDVSRQHLELTVPGHDRSPATVRDLRSSNGSRVFVPGRAGPVEVGAVPVVLDPDDVVQLGGSRIALRAVARPADLRPDGVGHLLVNRAPRPTHPQVEQLLTVPVAPPVRPGPRLSWPMLVLPLLFAVPAAWWWHQPMLLLMGLLSPVTASAQFATDRRRERGERRRADAAHRAAVAASEDRRRESLRQATRQGAARSPDPAVVAAVAAGRDDRLWCRGRSDDDLLTLRVGAADQPGPLTVRTAAGVERVPLPDAPVTVDLAELGVLGICGPLGPTRALARCLVGQAAVWCSPADLAVTVLTDRAAEQAPRVDWAWTAWLPHAAGALPDAEPGPDAHDRRPTGPGVPDRRHLVVLDAVARDRPGVARLLQRPGAAVVVCLAESRAQLPRECRAVLSVLQDDGAGTTGRLERPGEPALDCRLELPRLEWAWRLARALAPLRDGSPTAAAPGLPSEVRLLDLVVGGTDPAAVAHRWLAPAGRGLAAPLGVSEAGPWQVDLVRDGPHVLVAGTTGAGKSELLTSLVASLALHHSPRSLSLLLVDYKGGTAFGRLVELPHVTGVITDLDGAHAQRVLSSLTAELRRREAALVGARDADESARRLAGLGRLVVVVDEFRVLAEEQPEVLTALVRVATVGRGLGVHLVLATQRPAGVVTGEVRANVALRVALRVRDRADSEDVVDAPHAARLSAELPGRAWVRDASGRLLAVQAAHLPAGPSAGPDVLTGGGRDDLRWGALRVDPCVPSRAVGDLPPQPVGPRPDDDLDRVLVAVRAAATLLGLGRARAAWLPPLPERVTWAQLTAASPDDPARPAAAAAAGPTEQPGEPGDVALPFALADLPHRQQQRPMLWRLPAEGHLAVSGGPGSGRTTAARTLALAATAAGLEVHVIDGSGALAELSNRLNGSVVPGSDVERTVRLVRHLAGRIGRTTDLSDPADPSDPAHPTVLVVDGWEGLEQTWSRAGWLQGPDEVQALARDGTSVGLRLVVTGGRSLLSGGLAAVLPERLLLRTADPATALLAGVPTALLPSPWPDGRALRVCGSQVTPAQVALTGDDQPRVRRARLEQPGRGGGSGGPLRLAALPRRVRRDDLPRACPGGPLWLGVGGDLAAPLALPRSTTGCLVTGAARSGRTTALATLAHALADAGRLVVVVTDHPENPCWPRSPAVTRVTRRGGRLLDPPGPRSEEVLLLDDGWLAVPGLDDLAVAHLGEVDDGPDRDDDLVEAGAGGSLLRVAATVTTAELTVAFRGLVATLRDGGTALALGGRSWAADPLGGASTLPGSPPGRGLLLGAGAVDRLQLALPPSGASAPAARLAAVRQRGERPAPGEGTRS